MYLPKILGKRKTIKRATKLAIKTDFRAFAHARKKNKQTNKQNCCLIHPISRTLCL